MTNRLLTEVLDRVRSEGPFRRWRHEASETYDLSNLTTSAMSVREHAKALVNLVAQDNPDAVRRAAFTIMQSLYPIVDAIDRDSGMYLSQAIEGLRPIETMDDVNVGD